MATIAAGVLVSRPRIYSSILLAGAVSGGFDALYAMLYFGLMYGVQTHRIFQHIASGMLGSASFTLGWMSIGIGVICHFTVSTGAAVTYALAASRLIALARNPKLFGPIFGIGIYLFMNFVVIPLSRVAPRTSPPDPDIIVTGVLVHMFLIGLPIALIISAALRQK